MVKTAWNIYSVSATYLWLICGYLFGAAFLISLLRPIVGRVEAYENAYAVIGIPTLYFWGDTATLVVGAFLLWRSRLWLVPNLVGLVPKSTGKKVRLGRPAWEPKRWLMTAPRRVVELGIRIAAAGWLGGTYAAGVILMTRLLLPVDDLATRVESDLVARTFAWWTLVTLLPLLPLVYVAAIAIQFKAIAFAERNLWPATTRLVRLLSTDA